MRLRAAIAAALLLFAAPAFAQNVAEVGGSVGGVGSISLGSVSINQPILPTTINAAAPGVCPANQYETQDTTSGPVCAQPSFSQLTGTASNSQLAGPLVSALAVPAQFTISNPGGVGTATVGYTANSLAAHNFGTGLDLTGKLTGAQPAFSDVSGTATDAQLANAYSGVGACGANTWASTLSRNAAPTCTQPATTNLSDVSTGTWTPTIKGSSTAGTVTYTTQYGRYLKIGPLIFADFLVQWSAFSGAAGNLQVAGLPFANASATNNFTQNHIGDDKGITLTTGYTMLSLEIGPGTSVATLIQDGSGQTGATVAVGSIAAAGYIEGTFIYRNS